jgi:hypothetical protein
MQIVETSARRDLLSHPDEKRGEAMSDIQVEITFTPDKAGSTRGILTAKHGENVLHHDRLDIASDRQRTAFLNKLRKRCPSMNADEVEQLMLGEACRVAQAANLSDPQPPTELNVNRIIRPHLFHLPEVSGLLVPVARARPNKPPEGGWLICVQ